MRDDRDEVVRALLEEAEKALNDALTAFGTDQFPALIARHRRAVERLAALCRSQEEGSGSTAANS